MEIICDAHLDLAINAVSFDRDLTLTLDEINLAEKHLTDHPGRGRSTISLPEMRTGGVVLAIATLLARAQGRARPSNGFMRVDFDHATKDAASSTSSGQLAYYRLLESRNEISLVATKNDLEAHLALWSEATGKSDTKSGRESGNIGDLSDASFGDTSGGGIGNPIGIVLAMEGADSIIEPADCERWWNGGVRIASLVHYGSNDYAAGTGRDGPISDLGWQLLAEFERLGMILDLTHLSDMAMAQALEKFSGPLLATHSNCRELVPGQRQLTDDQIRLIAGRSGLICVALDAWMLYPGWIRGRTDTSLVSFRDVANQIEHIVGVTGSADCTGIGSDLDGGFGTEQTPGDCESIADLQKLPSHLSDRGYTRQDIRKIMSGNLIGFLSRNLPA